MTWDSRHSIDSHNANWRPTPAPIPLQRGYSLSWSWYVLLISYQTLMNVLEIPTIVAETMLHAQIPRDRSTAPVSRDSLEMDRNAKVEFSKHRIIKQSIRSGNLLKALSIFIVLLFCLFPLTDSLIHASYFHHYLFVIRQRQIFLGFFDSYIGFLVLVVNSFYPSLCLD